MPKYYKKVETRMKHDKVRNDHIDLINKKIKEFITLKKEIDCLQYQLEVYDEYMGYTPKILCKHIKENTK